VKVERRCWWCGNPAEVDTELPESGGMVKDSDTSWLCVDNAACVQRRNSLPRFPVTRRDSW
jgi:hypothetical protein